MTAKRPRPKALECGRKTSAMVQALGVALGVSVFQIIGGSSLGRLGPVQLPPEEIKPLAELNQLVLNLSSLLLVLIRIQKSQDRLIAALSATECPFGAPARSGFHLVFGEGGINKARIEIIAYQVTTDPQLRT